MRFLKTLLLPSIFILIISGSCEDGLEAGQPPAAPSGFSARAETDQSIVLTWTDNSVSEEGFRIERKTDVNGIYIVIGIVGVDADTCIDSGAGENRTAVSRELLPETEYTYRVCAYNSSGDSAFSNEASATTPPLLSIPVPADPSNLSAWWATDTAIGLLWTDNSSDEEGFRILRRTEDTEDYIHVASVSWNVTSFLDAGLAPNTNYYYRICAYNRSGDSGYSNEVSKETPGDFAAPEIPVDLKVDLVSNLEIGLRWYCHADNEDGFRIERKEESDGSYNQIAEPGPDAESFLDSDVEPGINYFYRIRSFNDTDNSDYSEERSVKTPGDSGASITLATIENDFNDSSFVFAEDLDSDGDMDIIGAANTGNTISWWENDGSENFTEHTVTTGFTGATSVYAADMDGDDDVDIIGTAEAVGEVALWENDGSENFTKLIISSDFLNAASVIAGDLDDDGDMDILGCGSNRISWWKNYGYGVFSEYTVTTGFSGAVSVRAADLNGDGDMDILGAAGTDNSISWWENYGGGSYGTAREITSSFNSVRSVHAADMDRDGDIDVIGSAYDDNRITWWENDGSGNYGSGQDIDSGFTGARTAFAADLDGDRDTDVIGGAETDGLGWWENDDYQNFTPHAISGSFSEVTQVFAADLDGDTDIDILFADGAGNAVIWCEMEY